MQQASKQITTIAVVGGGSAGWMSAALMANTLQNDAVQIVLIESEDIGTVGVGEATIPPIKTFNQRLGIDEKTFLKQTHGTFKLGIEFVNWTKPEHAYLHPFGVHGRDFDLVGLYQHWFKHRDKPGLDDLDRLSLASQMALHGKFEHPMKDIRYIQSTFDYAYHLDAGRYAAFLRQYAESLGVIRIEGKITDVQLDPQSGFISSVSLQSGQQVEADFFVDCSGFRSLLLGQALKTEYVDWTHWLPCDRAVAIPCESSSDLLPYTRSTKRKAGWQWRIPLQHRLGNGHVYCSRYVSDDEATQILLDNLDGAPLAEPNLLRFTTGHRRQFWHKNCVAIGLAAGFMEPLESTSLHLVVTGISRFLSLFPRSDCHESLISEYNALTLQEYEGVRDFLILHYYANQHNDQGFWQACANMDIPDSLKARLSLFKASGRLLNRKQELFQQANWLAVLAGQEVFPDHYDPLVDSRTVDGENRLRGIIDVINQSVPAMQEHGSFLKHFCAD